MKPFSIGTRVTLNFAIHGLLQGTEYTVNSVTNQGTKRNPAFRYYLGGAGFVDHEAISPVR